MARMSRAAADAPRYGEFVRIGGAPALDFVNTVTWRTYGPRRERFGGFEDVVAWATDALGLADARALRAYAARHPQTAARMLERAVACRGTLHAIFSALAAGAAAPAVEFAAFNRTLGSALAHASLEDTAHPRWTWSCPDNPLASVLDQVAWAAARLMAGEDVRSLRQCANPECGWVFLDRSPRGDRRWCGSECRGADKSRRYYARRRQRAAGRLTRRRPGANATGTGRTTRR
ncbi:MAG: CGNR zinc finger domain-containing protein [Betaproteobacteria bacterium]